MPITWTSSHAADNADVDEVEIAADVEDKPVAEGPVVELPVPGSRPTFS